MQIGLPPKKILKVRLEAKLLILSKLHNESTDLSHIDLCISWDDLESLITNSEIMSMGNLMDLMPNS